MPEGIDSFRAQAYSNTGIKSEGFPGDLAIYEYPEGGGHVQIVAKNLPRGDKWVIGGNQEDQVSMRILRKSPEYGYGENFVGFRKPMKIQPQQIEFPEMR